MTRTTVIAAAALFASIGAAHAQELRCVNRIDLFDIVVAESSPGVPNPLRIGTNPSCIEVVGNDVYIAGYNNSGSTIDAQVVKLTDYMNTLNFSVVPGAGFTMPPFYGFTGMSYRPGSGLIIGYDSYNPFAAGQVRIYNVSGPTPVLLAESAAGTLAAQCTPAWDAGFNGAGYTYTNSLGQSVTTALPAMMVPGQNGPFGLDPTRPSLLAGELVYQYDGAGNNLRMDFPGVTGLQWRDIDIHPTNGTMVARVNNDVVIGTRPNNSQNFVGQIYIEGGDAPFQVGQNVKILNGFPGGDRIVYNSRASGSLGQPFSSVVKFVNMQGMPANVTISNSTTPLPDFLPANNAFYDFAWDASHNRLIVADFYDYYLYVFDYVNTCTADFNGQGGINVQDIFDFLNAWFAGDPRADVNGANGVTVQDIFDFLAAWFAGCP